jgi:hypothetical protein
MSSGLRGIEKVGWLLFGMLGDCDVRLLLLSSPDSGHDTRERHSPAHWISNYFRGDLAAAQLSPDDQIPMEISMRRRQFKGMLPALLHEVATLQSTHR